MNPTLFLVLTFLCSPEVMHAFVRRSRAFKSNSFERLPYKRSETGYDVQGIGTPAENFPQLQDRDGGTADVTVHEMANLLAGDPDTALFFVMAFVDTDGDGMLSARELLPLSKRR